MPVREAELGRSQPAGALGGDDPGADEDLRPVAAVRARVHPDAAAGRAGDRAGELEAAETGRARLVEADGVRRPAAGDERLAFDAHRRELAREPEHERVDAVVGAEQVRAQTDRRNRKVALRGPGERLLELAEARRPGERASRPARADRRQPRQRHPVLDVHAIASSTSGPARSTSPAPTVRTRSPGRAQAATSLAPSSTAGAQPARMPGRKRVDDELAVDALDRLLACAVDLGDAGRVGARQCGAELVGEVAGARVEVRLEEHEHPARRALARRGDGRRDLGGVVGVVVEDRDPFLSPTSSKRRPAPRKRASTGSRLRARHLRARARRAPSRHCAGCAPPAPRARTTPARAPSRALHAAPPRASRRTSPRPRPPTRTWNGDRARRS